MINYNIFSGDRLNMFSNLHLQSKILIVAIFLILSSIGGLALSITINTAFPKNVAIAENKAPIKGKETTVGKKKEDKSEEKKDKMQDDSQEEKDSISYVVGKDIQKGIYKIFASGDMGTYNITDKKNPDSSDKMYFNFAYVSLKDGQTLTLTNSTMVSEDNLTPYSDKDYVDGQYKIGYDIKEGTYNVKPISGVGKIEIYSNLSNSEADITKYIEAPTTIKLKNKQYITITNVEISR